jgi:hypothetical protein
MSNDELIRRQQQRLADKEKTLKLAGVAPDLSKQSAEDFILEIVRDHAGEGLHRAMVIEAIRFYTEMVAAKEPTPLEDDNRIIPEAIWHETAVNIKGRLEAWQRAQKS